MGDSLGILVGAGSVGKRHAAVMAARYRQIVVIDVSSSAREWASTELAGNVTACPSLSEVRDVLTQFGSNTTAVIANWGPSHFATFKDLVKLGVRRIFCEKPLAVSLKQIDEIRRMCKSEKIALTAGLHLRYRGITEFVRRMTLTELGGLPTTMVVDGGARCLATNGSHWLDLAIHIFGCEPIAVLSSMNSAPINPRSKQLAYWGGTATWQFENDQRLTITYDNQSSVHEEIRLYAPTGVIEINSDFAVRAFQRNLDEVRADPRVVRVGQVRRDAPIAEYVPDLESVLSQQLDEIDGVRPIQYGSEQVLTSAAALVSAFESHRWGERVVLPPTADLIDRSIEWNIS